MCSAAVVPGPWSQNPEGCYSVGAEWSRGAWLPLRSFEGARIAFSRRLAIVVPQQAAEEALAANAANPSSNCGRIVTFRGGGKRLVAEALVRTMDLVVTRYPGGP